MNLQVIAIVLTITARSNQVLSFHTARQRRTQHPQNLNVAPQQLGEFEPISINDAADGDRARRRVWLYNFVNKARTTIPYNDMWDHQKRLVNQQLLRIGKWPNDPPLYDQFLPIDMEYESVIPRSLLGCDSIIMVEHDPVYTLGTASDASFIHGYQADDNNEEVEKEGQNIPIVRIERGGEVTYHGPGQLVVYPIIDLRGYKQDIHWYMRALEEVIILALEKSGVKGAKREDDLTGVWVSNKKIAALGIKARRWVTMHGLAINVDLQSLQNFEGIVPCGLEGREVTCINGEIESGHAESSIAVENFAECVREALEEIFGICLVPAPTQLHTID